LQGLAKYTDLFVRHEVDLQTFATLTEQDLREIGVQTFGARKKLLLLATSKYNFNVFCIMFLALYSLLDVVHFSNNQKFKKLYSIFRKISKNFEKNQLK
jgi:hypothetical protein